MARLLDFKKLRAELEQLDDTPERAAVLANLDAAEADPRRDVGSPDLDIEDLKRRQQARRAAESR